ncbi:MAG: DNA mismatch repair protein MutS [Bacteroidetes bacterium]|nr:DNA mismatch repair protein MutS [Bacteroidota bacterium]
MNKKAEETPLMQQYNQIKSKYPGCLVLFRIGDFYETFNEDAVTASKILGIILTKRANGAASHMDLAGFPYHSLDTYLPKLIRAGQRVAICEQLEDPKLTKKIVKRGVTELITPGVTFNDNVLEHKSNNYLASVVFNNDELGLALLDISTGEFLAAEGSKEVIEKLLQGFKPSEVIVAKKSIQLFENYFGPDFYLYGIEDWVYSYDYTFEKLTHHFATVNLKGFGIDEYKNAIIAAGAALQYLENNHHTNLSHISKIARIEEDQYVWLDRFTIRNLELLQTPDSNGTALIQILDKTITPMGGRMLKRWLMLPLKNKIQINERLEAVSYAFTTPEFANNIEDFLKQIGDLERLISKCALLRINPRELSHLKRSLKFMGPIKALCTQVENFSFQKIGEQLNECKLIYAKVEHTLYDDAPLLVSKGGIIKPGVNAALDELRDILNSGKEYILKIQKEEILKTGITSLKIAFNSVFGYYIEVTNAHKSRVPETWIRKQTLANAERYITEELKVYEEKVFGAEEKIIALEQQLYTELVTSLAEYIIPIQQNANILARLDCLLCFARIAKENNYVKPEISDDFILDLKQLRHPVIEKRLPTGESYIPNDVMLNNEDQQIIILTGPNMSGKSAVLRQTALAALMAQMGSFVAATEAKIGLVDKIFTRVGASDNLSFGESTFMVEMMETASIINNLSSRSLILLDEIGRGTSTYDGVSLAWSITEFLAKHPYHPRTIFATHYHELNELENDFTCIKNYHVKVKESTTKVIFLRVLVRGGSEHSFGIHVAKMAGIPKTILDRSNEILLHLESQRAEISGKELLKKLPKTMYQLNMFDASTPEWEKLKETLQQLEINTLSPIEALLKLQELKQLIK